MCLITFSYKQHPRYPLIFAANRDEYYDRPTRRAQFWDEESNILAGKDLKKGGTWMGITKEGKMAALTNYRDPSIKKENSPSRGQLVLNYLKNGTDPVRFIKDVETRANEFMGFNLLAGTPQRLTYYSNQQNNITLLEPGLYGLSNHLLDTPWPKVQRAKESLHQIIQKGNITVESLFDLLTDETQASDDELPDTGIPKEIEKKVSPIFIKNDRYGTRSSTILLLDDEGTITFVERRYKDGTTEVIEENDYRFRITNS